MLKMLKDETGKNIKLKKLKKLKSVELTHQTHNMRHEIEMTTWKVNHNKS